MNPHELCFKASAFFRLPVPTNPRATVSSSKPHRSDPYIPETTTTTKLDHSPTLSSPSFQQITLSSSSSHYPIHSVSMPLIDPVTMSKSGSGSEQNDWMSKLLGKKLGDSHDQMSFAKKDLPQESRVVEEGSMTTMDHKPERMNVHVDKEGIVKQIKWG